MLGQTMGAKEYFELVCREIQALDLGQIETVSQVIEDAYRDGRFVFIIGNGGSGANASHLCEDLAKCTVRDFENQKRLKVLSLTDNTAGIMAWGNDEGYDRIFIEQLKNLASPGDVLLAISGSGNSPNILRAVEWANANGMTTVGITGFGGGKLKTLNHHNLHAAIDDMGIVESLHSVAFHWIIDDLNRRFAEVAPVGGGHPLMTGDALLLGIEIGGTKLQLGLGHGDGKILAIERRLIQPEHGAAGILGQIVDGYQALLSRPEVSGLIPCGLGIGFGGPVDRVRGRVIRSHQIAGWDDFPLVSWCRQELGIARVAIENDADIAGLGEALHGSGQNLSPVFYVTIGSGIGGGLIVDGRIYRGAGASAEIGHLWIDDPDHPTEQLEDLASGWAIGRAAQTKLRLEPIPNGPLEFWTRGESVRADVPAVGQAASQGDPRAIEILERATRSLGRALAHVVTLLAPRRVILGGGVSLLGEALWLEPIRREIHRRIFPPLLGTFDLVPALLGEEVVVHGALALAQQLVAGGTIPGVDDPQDRD